MGTRRTLDRGGNDRGRPQLRDALGWMWISPTCDRRRAPAPEAQASSRWSRESRNEPSSDRDPVGTADYHFIGAPSDSISTASIATVTPRRKSLFFMEMTPCLFRVRPPGGPRLHHRSGRGALCRDFSALNRRPIAVQLRV